MHVKVALDDDDTTMLLHASALRLAQAAVPAPVAEALMSARMTALMKTGGRVRGIATGTAYRRLVASTLAREYGQDIVDACASYQYALSTRAGTECIAHAFRAATEATGNKCLLSVDGIGAYDHVLRQSMLGKLLTLPRASCLLPFVKLSYAKPTEYVWADAEGNDHIVRQGEGGEQGNPLMPLLFALGIHEALKAAASQLREGEDLCAFLDDVYAVCDLAGR